VLANEWKGQQGTGFRTEIFFAAKERYCNQDITVMTKLNMKNTNLSVFTYDHMEVVY